MAAACLLGLAFPAVGQAQTQQLDPQIFLPTAAPGSTFTIDRPTVPRHLTFAAGLGVNFATGLLVRGSDETDIVGWRAQLDLVAALGLFEWLELGVDVPLSLVSTAGVQGAFDLDPDLSTSFVTNDVRLMLKVPLVRGDFGLAARATLVLPTGDGAKLSGTDYWSGMPSVVMAYNLGSLTLAAEAGYRMRRRALLGSLEYDDEIQLSVGATYGFTEQLAAVLESQVRIGVGGRSLNTAQVPMELDGGLRVEPVKGVHLEGGAGIGLTEGYGSPGFRVFAAFRYTSEREPCEAGPEDFDGFEDGDFCADLDNDGDGIPDTLDECPNNPEDPDGFLDDDGCPDTDNDADGVPDASDQCPQQSEDRDGYQDDDGCPDLDNDEDGIPDGIDQCPMEPEDRDQYEDEDGCPEPGPDQATVTVTDTRILISERIYFDYDRDTIRSVSLPLLDQVAGVIVELPPDRRIRVEGHTDSEGNDQYNLDLSYRRARAVVEYLVSRGVPRDRVDYVGYGEQHPVAPNDSPEGRALNRRVEFTILEPGEHGH